MKYDALQKAIGYTFKDFSLLQTALTHTSYANEHRIESYERLEFLGDSVLGMGVAKLLFLSSPPLPEGSMTRLRAKVVCEETLAQIARSLNLGSIIRIGHGEEQSGGRERDSILADIVEAILAASYLDGGAEAPEGIIGRLFPEIIAEAASGQGQHDYKTALQEKMQGKTEASLIYTLVSEEGPAHARRFTSTVSLGAKVLGRGCGRSKKASEQMAAKEALGI